MTTAIETPETTTVELTREQEALLDWLTSKEVEDAGKRAEKRRKDLGHELLDLVGRDGRITVNKGGFATYTLKVTDGSRVSDAAVLKELAILHPTLSAEIQELRAKYTKPYVKIEPTRMKR